MLRDKILHSNYTGFVYCLFNKGVYYADGKDIKDFDNNVIFKDYDNVTPLEFIELSDDEVTRKTEISQLDEEYSNYLKFKTGNVNNSGYDSFDWDDDQTESYSDDNTDNEINDDEESKKEKILKKVIHEIAETIKPQDSNENINININYSNPFPSSSGLASFLGECPVTTEKIEEYLNSSTLLKDFLNTILFFDNNNLFITKKYVLSYNNIDKDEFLSLFSNDQGYISLNNIFSNCNLNEEDFLSYFSDDAKLYPYLFTDKYIVIGESNNETLPMPVVIYKNNYDEWSCFLVKELYYSVANNPVSSKHVLNITDIITEMKTSFSDFKDNDLIKYKLIDLLKKMFSVHYSQAFYHNLGLYFVDPVFSIFNVAELGDINLAKEFVEKEDYIYIGQYVLNDSFYANEFIQNNELNENFKTYDLYIKLSGNIYPRNHYSLNVLKMIFSSINFKDDIYKNVNLNIFTTNYKEKAFYINY